MDTTILCALCGLQLATTREHIPAQGLFAKPRPNDLVTVPACADCNNGSSADDEFLKSELGLVREREPSAALEGLRPSISRAMNRPEKQYFKDAYARRVFFDWKASASGKVLTLETVIIPDRARINRVVQKNIRGLFYHVTKSVLPADWGRAAVQV